MPVAVVGDYEVSRKIGEGGYGRIFLGRRITSSPDAPEVVLKQVKLPAKKFERETSWFFFVDVKPKMYVMTSLKYLRTPLERFGAVKKVTKD